MRERLIELLLKLPMEKSESEVTADYLLENGVVVPPVKVGDKIYIIENPYTFLPLKKPFEGEVVSIHLHEHGLYLRVLFDTKQINGCHDYNLDWKLSKTVFTTREAAENALKEREKG